MANIYKYQGLNILEFTDRFGVRVVAEYSTGRRMLQEDFNARKEKLEKEKREQEALRKQFEALLKNYIPKDKSEAIKAKFGGK